MNLSIRRPTRTALLSAAALLALATPLQAQEATTDASEASPTEGAIDVVQVEGGLVQGVETDVAGVQVFKGIPYAGSTGGENRFRPAAPVAPWEGVRVMDSWGDQTLQNINLNPVGAFWGDEFYYDPEFMPPASEDGLNLNVFTPAQSAGDKLPVYVWIHGGGNDHGHASEIEFWASKLAEKGIIVVPVQYRVGALGWLSLDAEAPDGAPGNMGLTDLVTALEWVRDNIEGFGGDPANVTIGGQSAGSRNVGMLLRVPEARGLFHRAVMQSASGGLLQTEYPTRAEQESINAEGLEALFGQPTSVADLRAIPAEDIITQTIGPDDALMHVALDGIIGGQFVPDGTTLTEESVKLLAPGALNGIDILIGANADERTSTAGVPDGTMTDEEFTAEMSEAYGEGWEAAYRPTDPENAYRLRLRSQADNLLQTALVSAQHVAAHNEDMSTFVYYFDNPPPGRNAEFYGSFHSADLWYFFNSLRDWPGQRPWTDADHRMAEVMSSYLANFVATGDPNGQGLPEWPEVDGGPALVRFADGYAYPVTSTPYPSRDAVNRAAVLRDYGMSEADLAR